MDTPVEIRTRILWFKQYLPRGPLPEGGYRKEDLVQLYTDPGGMRTIILTNIKSVR